LGNPLELVGFENKHTQWLVVLDVLGNFPEARKPKIQERPLRLLQETNPPLPETNTADFSQKTKLHLKKTLLPMIPSLQRTILLLHPKGKANHLPTMIPLITLPVTVTFLHGETDVRVGTNERPAKPTYRRHQTHLGPQLPT